MKPELTLHIEFSILLTLYGEEYCCLSDWLSAQLFALMHSSQVTFSFRTVCFLTVHATLLSILINAQKKCGGNRWLVKANIQTSWPWGHSKFASAVPWDLLWHMIPQLYRHLSSSPAAWPWWTLSQCGWYPMCTRPAAPQTPPHHSLRGWCRQPVKQLWGWRWRSSLCPCLISRLLFNSGVDRAK